ncbi:hypothetical protein NRB_15560 [Novosphingobium sp. 11B]
MGAELAAKIGRQAWLPSNDDDTTQSFLKRADPLGHRGWRHTEPVGRPFESSFTYDGRDSSKSGVIKHGLAMLHQR